MFEIIYVPLGGFSVFFISYPRILSIEEVENAPISSWKYLAIIRRTVRYPIVLKFIHDNLTRGLYYARIYFREQRDNPVRVLLYLLGENAILVLDSDPPYNRLVKSIIRNPQYSETLISVFGVKRGFSLDLYGKYLNLLKRMYLFTMSSLYERRLGRIVLFYMYERENTIELTACIEYRPVSLELELGEFKIKIKDIDKCPALHH